MIPYTLSNQQKNKACRPGIEIPGLHAKNVKNVANLTQLPQTGGVLAFAFWLACAMPLFATGGMMAVRGARNRRDALTLTHDGGNPAA